MSHRRSLILPVAGGLSLALACGSGGSGEYDIRSGYGRSETESAAPADAYGALDQGYVVAPDRAVIRVDIKVRDEDSVARRALLRSRADAVTAAVSDTCAAQVIDYAPAAEGDWEPRGSVELRLDVPLAALDSTLARMDALDACDAALAAVLTPADGKALDDGKAHLWVVRSAPVLLVDDLQQHAPTLLARRAAALATVAGTPAAPQLHPEDLRCTPIGSVEYGARRLSGVQLSLGMDCRVAAPPDAGSPDPA